MEYLYKGHRIDVGAQQIKSDPDEAWKYIIKIDGGAIVGQISPYRGPYKSEDDAIGNAKKAAEWVIDHPPATNSSVLDEIFKRKP